MTMEVLQSRQQITEARRELVRKGVSFIDSPLRRFLRSVGRSNKVAIGDKLKSWDVQTTLSFIEKHLRKDAPILDIGCYASEVLLALHRTGYSKLTGVDLNPRIRQMPYQTSIRYEVADFMATNFEDGSFRAITAISVIEHGLRQSRLLREIARLLEPKGFFAASFDYWPQKVDTREMRLFGMDWTILSKEDVTHFLKEAEQHRLFPLGDLKQDGDKRVIRFAGKQYTFAWMVLQKR